MHPIRPITIVAFGDSITAAAEVSPPQRWPALLEDGLRALAGLGGVRVINAGVGGNTTREGLARIERDVLPHNPDLVLVEFGNDATFEPERHVTHTEFAGNLAIMKARFDALGHTKMVLVVFPPVIDGDHQYRDMEYFKARGGLDAEAETYRRVTRRFAAENSLPIVHIDRALRAAPAEYILPDGVHLTAAGNRVVAQTALPIVVQSLSAE